MMKNVINKNSGVTLVSLAIAVSVILILTGVIIYNVRDNLGISNLREMQSDIQNLRDLVSDYYSTNGKIPAKLKYTNTENIERIRTTGVISEEVDIGDFYIIDLSELENLTLNYGEDYKNISNATTEDEASQYEDIYIINETSQNIFYVAGIQLDGEMFYTDYTSEDVDKVAINLRYFDGVKIPEGFYYVGGTKDEGLVISDVQGDDLDNSKQGNQFVWVPVENFDDFKREHFGTDAQKWWGTFVTDMPSANNLYEPIADGIMEDTEVEKMYKSVKENKGFYVGRFEAGTTASSGTGIRGEVVSKKGANVYNYIGFADTDDMTDETGGAVEVARGMYNEEKGDSVTSTLTYGVQWDAIMRWMKDVPNLTGGKYLQDSTGMGWYSDNASGNSTHKTGIDLDGGKNVVKNIYDLAGNAYEWTMESYSTNVRVTRGGGYDIVGSYGPASSRGNLSPSDTFDGLGFRVALYLNLEEKWSPTYDVDGTYTDKNGDTATIPAGFQVSEKKGETLIDEGLVIRNATTDDRYVWIEVPKSIYTTATSETDYSNIEKDMQTYTAEYKEGYEGYSDTWYEGCGIDSEEEYNNLKNKMLSSVYKNGGFWIGQYEAGADSYPATAENDTRELIIQEGAYPYNFITCSNAQIKSSGINSGNYTSSLMFGIQWDLVLKHLETHGVDSAELTNDSGNLGNYLNETFDINRGGYTTSPSSANSFTLLSENEIYTKLENIGVLLTTGEAERNSRINIYDLAGNVAEWTLEKSPYTNMPCVSRGGSYYGDSSGSPASYRDGNYTYYSSYYNAFRPVLY